jgi:hypothetical protein
MRTVVRSVRLQPDPRVDGTKTPRGTTQRRQQVSLLPLLPVLPVLPFPLLPPS